MLFFESYSMSKHLVNVWFNKLHNQTDLVNGNIVMKSIKFHLSEFAFNFKGIQKVALLSI